MFRFIMLFHPPHITCSSPAPWCSILCNLITLFVRLDVSRPGLVNSPKSVVVILLLSLFHVWTHTIGGLYMSGLLLHVQYMFSSASTFLVTLFT